MLKTVKSYFKPLTREQFELRTLQSTQEARLQLEARSTANASVIAEVINLVGDTIIIDGDDVGDVVPVAFEQILEDLDGEVVPVAFAQIIDDYLNVYYKSPLKGALDHHQICTTSTPQLSH